MPKRREKLVEYYGNIKESSPLDDILYWQEATTTERFVAGLDIMRHYYRDIIKDYESRLNRTLIVAGQMESPLRHHRRLRGNGVHRTKGNERS